MKKLLLLSVLIPSSAMAEGIAFNPYIGLDLQRTNYEYNDNYALGGGLFLDGDIVLEDALNGFNVHVGNRFTKNFGVELGYFKTKEEGKNIAAGETVGPGTVAATDLNTDVDVQGLTLDALGYYPVLENAEIIGTLGVSWSEIEAKFDSIGSAKEDDFGYRAGAGAQYNFTQKVSVRGLARYQSADFDDIADSAWTYSMGVNYAF